MRTLTFWERIGLLAVGGILIFLGAVGILLPLAAGDGTWATYTFSSLGVAGGIYSIYVSWRGTIHELKEDDDENDEEQS